MITSILSKLFIKDWDKPEEPNVRLAYGMLAGWVGISVNILLFVTKMTTGLLAGSVAMAADAVNNLSDSGSSAITILGFKLSAKPADNEHPFGHGRLEYVASLVISIIIIIVGVDFFEESVRRLFSRETTHANALILGIFSVTILFKVWLFFFYRAIGKKIKSKVLTAMALDSLSDLISTSIVILAVVLGRYTKFPVDGCAGIVVGALVIAGGIGILRDSINPLLGECPDPSLVQELEKVLLECPGICGVHDIILHNYGPHQYFATAHAEISKDGDLLSAHDTLENAEVIVAQKLPIRLILHCDPYSTEDPEVKNWRIRMENVVARFDPNFKLYDFHLENGSGPRQLHFALLMPRNYALSHAEIADILNRRMKKYDPALVLRIDFEYAYV